MKLAVVFVIGAIGCQDNLDAKLDLAALDRPYFDCKVQPVLTKSCGALACHGDPLRFFHLFSRNRNRLDPDPMQLNALMTTAERDHNFAAALAVIDADNTDKSEILLKPLAEAAGGWYHEGAELYKGGDVFTAKDDPDYQVLTDWIGGATEVPTCMEPGSGLP